MKEGDKIKFSSKDQEIEGTIIGVFTDDFCPEFIDFIIVKDNNGKEYTLDNELKDITPQ